MEKKNFVLAMYDVRGKQNYIFRSTKIKEIVGASAIIRDVYDDYLFPAAKQAYPESLGIFNPYPSEAGAEAVPFTEKGFRTHLEAGFIGEVVYNGGGNFIVLFKDRLTFEKVTHDFTLEVLTKTGSLRVIGTCVEIEDFSDYRKDQERLYNAHRKTENTVQNVPLYASIPPVMTDPFSSMPVITREKYYFGNNHSEVKELTHEQKAKYAKYAQECKKHADEVNEQILDKIAPEKGRDSHIAVIYIDGNSMGAKVQKATEGVKGYEESVQKLRAFSKEIQHVFIDSKKPVIDAVISRRHHGDKAIRRLILGAGDEINMICAGVDAYEVAAAYLKDLGNANSGYFYSSCAGIAVFKSHMPYADAYRIAEECCESGKDEMKKRKLTDSCFLDFHLCQGATDISLDQIREHEDETLISRPWLITCGAEDQSRLKNEAEAVNEWKDPLFTESEVSEMAEFLRKLGHSNVKGLLGASTKGITELQLELNRIYAHQSQEKKQEMQALWNCMNGSVLSADEKEHHRRLIHDLVLMFDYWFFEEGGETA